MNELAKPFRKNPVKNQQRAGEKANFCSNTFFCNFNLAFKKKQQTIYLEAREAEQKNLLICRHFQKKLLQLLSINPEKQFLFVQ